MTFSPSKRGTRPLTPGRRVNAPGNYSQQNAGENLSFVKPKGHFDVPWGRVPPLNCSEPLLAYSGRLGTKRTDKEDLIVYPCYPEGHPSAALSC